MCRHYYTRMAICLFKLKSVYQSHWTLIILAINKDAPFVTTTFWNCSSSHEKHVKNKLIFINSFGLMWYMWQIATWRHAFSVGIACLACRWLSDVMLSSIVGMLLMSLTVPFVSLSLTSLAVVALTYSLHHSLAWLILSTLNCYISHAEIKYKLIFFSFTCSKHVVVNNVRVVMYSKH